MFLDKLEDPSKYKSARSPKTPVDAHDVFGYSQSPEARREILKLRERLNECRTKLKQCEKKDKSQKGKTKKKKRRKTVKRSRRIKGGALVRNLLNVELASAVMEQDLSKIKSLLERGANPNTVLVHRLGTKESALDIARRVAGSVVAQASAGVQDLRYSIEIDGGLEATEIVDLLSQYNVGGAAAPVAAAPVAAAPVAVSKSKKGKGGGGKAAAPIPMARPHNVPVAKRDTLPAGQTMAARSPAGAAATSHTWDAEKGEWTIDS